MPFQGARIWAISSGLKHFVDSVAFSPRLQRITHEGVQAMLKAGPPPYKSTVNIRLPRELDTEFNNLFPEWGASTWFVRTYMDKLVAYMVTNNVSLNQLAEVAVGHILSPVRTSNTEDTSDTHRD